MTGGLSTDETVGGTAEGVSKGGGGFESRGVALEIGPYKPSTSPSHQAVAGEFSVYMEEPGDYAPSVRHFLASRWPSSK